MSPITMLFVPADRAERFAKAAASGADAIVIDLEDAVAPESKDAARRNIIACDLNPERVYIRVNPSNTADHQSDIEGIEQTAFRNIMLAKAEHVADLDALVMHLGPATRVVPLVETAWGLENVRALASHASVPFLAFGSLDFALDLGCEHTPEALAFARYLLVFHSRLAQKSPPLDGVTVAIEDAPTIRADAARGKDMGFGGKLLIHPKQIKPVLDVFTPSEEELAWALSVRQAIVEAGSSAVRVNGQMVDRPVILRAERILSRSLETTQV
ncbi:CoA ester lyase [Rhizobium leguminosarum]|uniref:HpcH/HpaI aldolase/citrate lyase family protein n=1 Tax=Rhizobium leguminosarum TaxID=384 RepID=UPI0024A9A2CD|nr:CoA ester lyase [Rhizobium leguminosarum]MDI5929528.1 CoA ester lyase [Rhizobium leguminosarum]